VVAEVIAVIVIPKVGAVFTALPAIDAPSQLAGEQGLSRRPVNQPAETRHEIQET
jgi:hypothetical protein